MNKTVNQRESGFTIIEVVLVLAIAALIMLMVFLALPALQRGQRDTQRKDDISRMQSQINSYKSSNRGAVPPSNKWDDFETNYLLRGNDQFADPSGSGKYNIVLLGNGTDAADFTAAGASADAVYSSPSEADKLYVHYGGNCDFANQKVTAGTSGARKIIILKALEGGGYECREA